MAPRSPSLHTSCIVSGALRADALELVDRYIGLGLAMTSSVAIGIRPPMPPVPPQLH